MKKLLMLGAILVLGATAFAKEAAPELENQSEAKVTVKARLVAENLVISDLEGNPIILDFGKVSKTRDKGTSEAKTGYMVRYVGDESNLTGGDTQKLAMELKGTTGDYVQTAVPVTLAEVSQEKDHAADTFEVTVGLNTYEGTMPKKDRTPGKEDGHDYAEYTGMVFGTLNHAAANPLKEGKGDVVALSALDSGDYIGFANLKVTINGGKDFQ